MFQRSFLYPPQNVRVFRGYRNGIMGLNVLTNFIPIFSFLSMMQNIRTVWNKGKQCYKKVANKYLIPSVLERSLLFIEHLECKTCKKDGLTWEDWAISFDFSINFNLLQPSAAFLYPLKTPENLKVFWCFQGV